MQRRFARALDELVRKYRPDQQRAPKGTPEGGQWVDGVSGSTPGRHRTRIAWMPMGFTKHGINQAINRGIASGDILDALNNPTDHTRIFAWLLEILRRKCGRRAKSVW